MTLRDRSRPVPADDLPAAPALAFTSDGTATVADDESAGTLGAEAKTPSMTLRSLLFPVYLPALLFAIGQGVIIPVIPLLAREAGASIAAASIVVGMRGIGTMAFDVPAGQLVGRWGERRTMVLGTALLVVATVGCILVDSTEAIAAFVFVMGCGWAVWLLARLSFVSDAVSPERRGRALSTLGGVNRAGNFIGPFLSAGLVALGGLNAAFALQAAVATIGCVLLVLSPVHEGHEAEPAHVKVRFRSTAREHAGVFARAGVAASCISLLRAVRQVVIPLWGAHLGLGAAEIALVFGFSSALDLLLFYPSGVISDRVGRKIVGIACLATLALGLLLMPFASSTTVYVLVALLLGAGNGIGTGIVMIMGADFSPANGRAEFLGAWRLITDVGQAGGPLVIAAATALVSLSFASVVVGAVGLLGAAYYARFVPETLERRLRRRRRDRTAR